MTTLLRHWRWLAAAISIAMLCIAYYASHIVFPNLWLPASAEKLASEKVERVNAHRYDSQWFDAARAGRWDITEALLQAGYPVDSRTGSGYTALVLSTYHGHAEQVARLLAVGADPCVADNNGNTALMGALFKGELAVANVLLDKCPVDQMNNAGQTALAFAALFGRLSMVPPLVALGADPNHRDYRGDSIMATVLAQDNQPSAHALIAVGAR